MPSPLQWTVERGGAEDVIRSGHGYGLRNTEVNRYVVYGQREWGINLVWRTAFWWGMWFQRQNQRGNPIHYGDTVALAFAHGGEYVRYHDRTWGINLVWSQTPVYEWRLTGGPTGSEVQYGNVFSLFNQTANAHVVHCDRVWGISLSWDDSCFGYGPQPTECTVTIRYRIPLLEGIGSAFGTVHFEGLLTGPQGSTGATSFNRTDQWEAPPAATEAIASVTISGLRAGTWRIDASVPFWVAACTVDLTPGYNEWVNFSDNTAGCERGFGFPALTASREDRPTVENVIENPPAVEDLPNEGLDEPEVAERVLSNRDAAPPESPDRDLEPFILAATFPRALLPPSENEKGDFDTR